MFYAEGDRPPPRGSRSAASYPAPVRPARAAAGAVEKALGASAPTSWRSCGTPPAAAATALWRDIDKPEYALSWNPDKARWEA